MNIKKKSWNDITISDYKKIKEITEREFDSELEKGIAVLSVLCDVDEDEVYSLPISQLKGLLDGIAWMNEPYTFDKNWKADTITINGEKYDIVADINKFTVAQYADFQIYWDKRDDVDYMAKLLSVFIIPKGKTYNDGYDIVELIDILENNISINIWNSINFFFLKDLIRSIEASLYYSLWVTIKMIWKEKNKEKKKELKEMKKKLLTQIKTFTSYR